MDCSAEDFQDLEFVTDEGRLALIVGTSGTTATPKIIPLSEKRLILATENMQNIFDLTADDICFCPMPLYHTHGLVTGLLSALCSGGSIMCVAKFDPRQMLDLVADIKATWVTAAPAIYQSVLKVAAQNSQMHAKTGLRFVRSSSAALPASVMKTIEAFFRAPVIETYGITEASVVASNPLPPADRKAGSVGFPTNVDIKIMRSKSDSKSGEICLRGPIVIDGYECNSAANDVSFSDGWFLTGDLGYFDQNGYLFLIGRKGDSIKRGANLVALADIDSALIELDELSDGAAYKVAHQTLGNDIRAAVVVTAGCEIDGPEIRSKLLKSLPAYKVPSHIDVVDEIPRSATGKILRGILAELLAANVDERATPPSTEIQKEIASIWEDMLEVENVGLEDDFFSAGGDSLNLIIFLETVSERYGIELGPEEFLETPQLLAIADLIDCLQKSKTGN
jgi:acyl-CoA synthetase (AMP-forming)/AMP-acid ligase II/acyl carrier protein